MSNLNVPVSVKSIAFIDTQVPNYQSLVAGVTPGTEVVVLDGNQDAIGQITEILALHTNIDSIHIVSHGAPGSLQLGDGSLSLDDLEGDRHSLQQWFSPLGKNRSNILLYGCEVAAGETGKAFVKRLSELTGASVAASQNLTGSVAKGGDWELEVTTGKIKTPLVFAPEILANYEHVLNSFKPATNFTVGTNPVLVDAGDFNGDGIKDLAVTNSAAANSLNGAGTSILLGNTAGSFDPAINLTQGSIALAIAKFNPDNYDDLVVNNGPGSVSIFFGSSSGLGAPVNLSFDARIFPEYIAVGNFNDDNRPDIAIATRRFTGSPNTNSGVSILLQNIDGTFSVPVSSLVGRLPQSIAIGDFDGDGKQDDLAVSSRVDNTVSILLAGNNGAFTNGPTIPVAGAYSIATGKFDADNTDDLAVTNNNPSNTSILLQKTPGTFTAAPNLAASGFVAAGDIDGDGKTDLAFTGGAKGVLVMIGKGNGEFSTPSEFPVSSANSYSTSVVVKDIDGDKRPDIAATIFNDNNVSVLLNTPNTVNFGAATYNGTEGTTDTVVNIPVTISGGTPFSDVTVPIAIDSSSTATQNLDYTIAPTSITFPAGATGEALTKNVAVTIKPDNLPENAETAILNFGTITGGVGGTTKQTTLTIAANGQISYAVAADTASIPEGNSGTTPLTFTVTRSGSTAVASSVNYTIAGTATNVSDYNSIGGTSGATAATGTINFAADETSKTITLNVLGDGVVETDETIAVTLSNPVAPGLTPAITTATSTITINNDDTASFKIAPTSTTATEGPGGATGSYTVKLTSQPSVPVTVSFNTGSQINAISPPIIFDSTNWNVAQTVTVTATDDSLAEKTHSGTITHAAATTDTTYSSLTIPTVTVSITDNDSPGVSIIQSAGSTDIGEGATAATDTYKLVLTTAPTAPVIINFDSGSQINAIASLTFTPANWNVAQTVSVSAIDDSLAEGTHSGTINHTAVSTDTNYNGLTISPVTATIADNDTEGVSIAPTSTTATEGGVTGSYTVKLKSQPTAPVTINFNAGSQINAISPIILDSTNWKIGQTVTVTATNDTKAEGSHGGTISHTVTSADTKYSGKPVQDVNVVITDNETATVSISPATTTATEGGATGSYTVKLNSEPSAPVNLSFNTGSQINAISAITFDSTSWNVGKAVTVTATDDTVAEGAHSGTISHTVTSSDTQYSGTPVQDVNVAITDNETAGVNISPTSTTATEGGATGSYTVKLNSKPNAPVNLRFNTSAQINAISAITFDSTNWNVAKTVTVSAVDDTVAEGAHSGTITHTVTSTDTQYSGKAVQDVNVAITDNETAGVSISPTSTTATEGGATGSYTVKLNSQPSAPVNLSFNTGNQINPISAITFDSSNWNVAKTVKVIATDDEVLEGAHSGSIAHTVTSTDGKYNGIGIAGVSVAIEDNDKVFTNKDLKIPEIRGFVGANAWGDYDNDGDLDLLVMEGGSTLNNYYDSFPRSAYTPKVYSYDKGSFTPVDIGLPTVYGGAIQENGKEHIAKPSATWGDSDNDGDLDILLIGVRNEINSSGTESYIPTTTLWANPKIENNRPPNATGNTTKFTPAARLPGMFNGSAAWGDYNNNGRPDLLLTGDTSSGYITKVFRNDRIDFGGGIPFNYGIRFEEETGANLPGVIGNGAWGDYDNDGKPDILLAGDTGLKSKNGSAIYVAKLYQNTGNGFTESKALLQNQNPNEPINYGAWGDTNNDGQLDILLTGTQQGQNAPWNPSYTRVLNSSYGEFKEGIISGYGAGFGAWGDQDNDGDIDILLTGTNLDQGVAKVYRNKSNSFELIEDAGLPKNVEGPTSWGDYDKDDRLDIALTTRDNSGNGSFVKIYRNYTPDANKPPSAPQFLNTFNTSEGVVFNWRPGESSTSIEGKTLDSKTPNRGLSYNLKVWTTDRNSNPDGEPVKEYIVGPMSSDDGTRQVVQLGNVNQARDYSYGEYSWLLKPDYLIHTPYDPNYSYNPQTYQWSVQAIDTTRAGSPFVEGKPFIAPYIQPTLTISATDPNAAEIYDPVIEKPNPGKFTITRNGGSLDKPLTVRFKVDDLDYPSYTPIPGAAIPRIDYELVSESEPDRQLNIFEQSRSEVVIPAGKRSVNMVVNVRDDRLVEGDEKVVITLDSEYYSQKVGEPSSATVTIADNDRNNPVRTGVVIDGYIDGANLFLDANKNGTLDTNEPSTTTDTGGKFDLNIPFETFDTNKNGEIDPSEGNLVATGGTDTATGLPLEIPITAPPDSTVVTPLTSLIAELIDKGIAPEEAQSLIKATLGIPANVDLTSFDPIDATNNNQPGGVQVLAAMVKVQNFITQTVALIDGASSAATKDLVKAVVSSITNQIQSSPVLNLSNAAALEPIIQQAAAKIQQIDSSFNIQKVTSITSQAATVMATANQRIDSAVSGTATSIPQAVARVQQVALGATTQDFKAVGTGSKTISQVVADNTGAALDTQIQAVTSPVGIATPIVTGDADLGSNSGNPIDGTNGDDILTGTSSNDVFMGMRGNDSLDGAAGNDTIFGGKGFDILLGSGGDDALFAGRGADNLNGGDGNDSLYGGKGDDLLNGGLGNDTLIGGKGFDKFLVDSNSDNDTIADFEDGKDLLILGNGLTFSQLAITESNGITQIGLAATGKVFASLTGVSATAINAADFSLL